MNYRTRAQNILKKIDLLAQYSDHTSRWERSLGSQAQKSILEHLTELMETLGLEVYTDSIGNLRARLTSHNSEAQYLIIGGSTDTVKNGGKFDGTFNILMALEIVAKILEENVNLPFHIEIVAFVDGSQTYFELPYLGCRYLIGQFDPAWFDRKNKKGQTLADLIQNLTTNKLIRQTRRPEDCLAYLQFTLSDTAFLDQELIPLGISRGICGHAKFKISFSKSQDYNLKPYATSEANLVIYAFSNALSQIEYYTRQRQEWIQSSINNLAYKQAVDYGLIEVISFEVNIFGLDDKILSIALQTLKNQISKTAKSYGINFHFDLLVNTKAVKTNPKLNEILARSIIESGSEVERVESFESQPLSFLAASIPSCMLVLRSEKGLYRQPDEYVRLEDIMVGLKVGEKFISKLAQGIA